MNEALPSAERMAQCRVLVVGDVMLDRYWHGEVARISPEAPVPVVHVQREESRLGGAANVALNIQSLGGQVTLLSMVGADAPARELRGLLQAHGLAHALVEDPEMDTIVKLRVIGRAQQMLRIDFEKAPARALLEQQQSFFEGLLSTHDLVVFSDYDKGGLAQVATLVALAKAAGKPVLVDPKGTDWQRYAGVEVITPNRAELAQVVGIWHSEAELARKVESLREQLQVHAVLLTRSEEGMTLFEAGQVHSVAAQAREVSDVTGAGDTVIATLALMVACGLDLRAAMGWANRAGAWVVERFGTAFLTHAELSE